MKFKSKKYLELGFYVDGEYKQFVNGVYATTDKKEIDLLQHMKHVEEIECEEIEINLEDMTVDELKDLAAEKGIKLKSKMNKDEIIEAIEGA
ncbi:Rho termination factor N-terminal domain-containing protein [Dethiothermospora halolimnae]|uniref:Rho termination factor N-terminal domain-containing protein n=1 Tax=Dethiothermospora halolimnae TaxID=3114390 RepID=UPI003CCC38C8